MSDTTPRIGRRSLVLGGAAALTGGALALQGLTRGDRSAVESSQSAASAPRRGGHLRVAFDGAAISAFVLDPHNSGFAPHNRVMRSIYDSLTRLLPDQTVGPWLAESIATSPDRTSYTFKLRRGVTFHDGTACDAAAVKANFDRVSTRENALSSRSSLGPYSSSEVVSDDTLRVTLSEPFTPFLRNLSMTKLALVSPAAVAKYGSDYAQNPVGTGPFRFVGLQPGKEIRLERNPKYTWAAGPDASGHAAYVDALTFINVPEESTRVAVLQSAEVHAADLIPPQNLGAFRANPAFTVLEKELLNTNYALSINVTREPWNDAELRLAVRLSLDIDTIVRVIYLGTLSRAWSSLSPSMFGSAEAVLRDSWRPDPARARELLDRKGWMPGADGIRELQGKRLSLRFIDSQGNREKRLDVMQLIRRQLAATGVGLSIETLPSGTYASRIAQNEYELTAGASFHADPDILRQAYVPGARVALGGTKVDDPEIIAWLNAAAREAEGPARAELYQLVQQKIVNASYAVPVYVLLYNLAVARAARGVTIDAHGFPEFHRAWLAT
jgi:peptide/nickel transport system substrate-binding protein